MPCFNPASGSMGNGFWMNDCFRNQLAQLDCIGIDYDSFPSSNRCFPCGGGFPYPCPPTTMPPMPNPNPISRTNYLSSVSVGAQSVAAGAAVLFTADRASNGNAIRHTPGTGTFTLTGPGVFLVTLNLTAAQTLGTLGPVAVSLAADGVPIAGTTVTALPGALSQAVNLSTSTIVPVPACTTVTLSVLNSGAESVDFSDANLNIVKIG